MKDERPRRNFMDVMGSCSLTVIIGLGLLFGGSWIITQCTGG